MALTSLAGLPAANAAIDQPIVIYGGGGGGGGGSKGQGTSYTAGQGGEGGASGLFDEAAPPAYSGADGSDGTINPNPENVGEDGIGGAGAAGLTQIGFSSPAQYPGEGRVGMAGGRGGSGVYQYLSGNEAATIPSVTVVAGNGGDGGDAGVNAGGNGGNGGNATGQFWRVDANPAGGVFPDALTVAGSVYVRSGHRGVTGEPSFHPTVPRTPNENGGPGGFPGDAALDVQGTLQAKDITVIRRDGAIDVDVDRLLVPEGETTTITVVGTEPGDVTIDHVVVEDDATLIIDNSQGSIEILNPPDVADTGQVIVTNPGNVTGDGKPGTSFTASTSLVSPLRLPSPGGAFSLPLTGTGLATAETRALLGGQVVAIAAEGDSTRSNTEAWLPVAFQANTTTAAQTYTVLVSNGGGIWIPLALDVVVAAPGGTNPPLPFVVVNGPSISGSPEVGARLTVDPGAWVPNPNFAYQWLRNGTAIAGATAVNYKVEAADAGTTITARVTATGTGMEPATRVTPGLAIPAGSGGGGNGGDDNGGGGGGGGGGDDNGGGGGGGGGNANPPVGPSDVPNLPPGINWTPVQVAVPGGVATVFLGIAGTARVGQTFTARVVTTSTAAITYGYQWLRSGKAISGATKAKYKLVAKDRKKRVAVRLTATPAGGGAAATVLAPSKVIKIGVLKTTRPKITGTVRVGRTLKANATKWTAGAKKKYQWYRAGKKIAGATKAKYKVKAADRGRRVTVKVKGTKSGFKAVTRASASKLIR
jgi:hypothetical protein